MDHLLWVVPEILPKTKSIPVLQVFRLDAG